MVILVNILIFVFGTIIGSFLGALTYRLPIGKSISTGRSKCPKCKKTIAWFDNIPLFSFLILGGKCRNCKKTIPLRYPLIELFTGIIFSAIFWINVQGTSFDVSLSGVNFGYILHLFIVSALLIAIFVIDLEYQIIPDEFVFALFGLVLFAHILTGNKELFEYVFSGFAASLFLLLLHFVTLGKGMGLGDVKLALFAGTFFGFPLFITWLYLAFLIGAAVGVFLIALNKAKFGQKIAFGPFLVLSFFLTLFWGDAITLIAMPFLK